MHPMGRRKLEEIIEKDPTEIVLDLGDNPGFKELLKVSHSPIMGLVLQALLKASQSPNRALVMKLFSNTVIDDQFLLRLLQYISALQGYSADPREALLGFTNVVTLLKVLRDIAPHYVHSNITMLLPCLESAMNVLRARGLTVPDCLQDLMECKQVPSVFRAPTVSTAPNDFREIPVIPGIEDILTERKPFLRPNILNGGYDDVWHYLDVQFRLLREDFIRPLREGIRDYLSLEGGPADRLKDVRLYTDTRIAGFSCTDAGLVHYVTFKTEKRINWETSKRLLTGSLIAFSLDGFQTMLFATVVQRNVQLLSEGKLPVQFSDLRKVADVGQDIPFVMIETSSYFEAYKHNLLALQQLTPDTLPLQKYIVEVNVETRPPPYLSQLANYDLSPIMKNGMPFETTKVCDRNRWPSRNNVSVDESQFQAIHAALTSEFSIIQGPPGTGKTFVGLTIVDILLRNKCLWYNSSPILVVCYTNRALDQFLESILQFTQQIVRVGGRCTNEHLMTYQLAELRRTHQERRDIPQNLYVNLRDVRRQLEHTKALLKERQAAIHRATKSVLFLEDLEEVVDHDCYESFFERPNIDIEGWLEFTPGQPPEAADAVQEEVVEEEEDEVEFLEGMRVVDEVVQLNEDDVWRLQGHRKGFRKELEKHEPMAEAEAADVTNVWRLRRNDRWRLYSRWVQDYVTRVKTGLQELQEEFCQKMSELKELRQVQDLIVLKSAHVVGMTTTGAAKFHSLVEQLRSRIVIVEEAAELLETHVVTSLSPATEQLILIGDHQQLRPSVGVYELAKHYKLDVSLFERMLMNGMQCSKLERQHRMRPDFVHLLVPHIYRTLDNDESVLKYEDVLGVSCNLFFLTHDRHESGADDSKSRSNQHEGEFLAKLCKYLILQGYAPSQITILTTYSGQVFLLRKIAKQEMIAGVRITAVDNFQGEENDIILLSFVRSNAEGNIGFLKAGNRVCVALSRAREGLFCVGNFEMMARSSKLWEGITLTLQAKAAIGNTLVLKCPRHPERLTPVSSAADFRKVPEGGCNLPCGARLICGHACSRICHAYDVEHKEMKCTKPCAKIICARNHTCRLKCYETCAPCRVPVVTQIPSCEHWADIPCSVSPSDWTCRKPCIKTLKCGHLCPEPCGSLCSTACNVKVTVRSKCGHDVSLPCKDAANYGKVLARCRAPCTSTLSCEHPCKGTCGSCFQNRFHKKCSQKCGRVLVCGHECKEPCAMNCPPCRLKCENECQHSRCRKKCGDICVPCSERCLWQCKHQRCEQLCCQPCLRPPCQKPCERILPLCKHPCVGFCGEPCPKLCRICNREELTSIFFGTEEEEDARFVQLEDCGHVLEESGLTSWMQQSSDAIQVKTCPMCKTPIRKNLRYANVVKQCLEGIEKVKRKALMPLTKEKGQELRHRLALVSPDLPKHRLAEQLESKDTLQANIENFVSFFEDLSAVHHQLSYVSLPPAYDSHLCERIANLHKTALAFVQTSFEATPQRFQDIAQEVYRLKLLAEVLKMVKTYSQNDKVTTCLTEALSLVTTIFRFERDQDVKELLQRAQKYAGDAVINVSDTEKREILGAMDLSRGHWYQCPNGHVYAITECGGAMQEGKCNECGAIIGGARHALRADNRVATAMDGAQHPAWSEMNNLGNFELLRL
ncbi:NFX1-type zinc finger-containing protein 1-like isoform X2 [Ornithodoros turicata]